MKKKIIGAKKARMSVPSQCRRNTMVSVFSQRVHVWRMNAIVGRGEGFEGDYFGAIIAIDWYVASLNGTWCSVCAGDQERGNVERLEEVMSFRSGKSR